MSRDRRTQGPPDPELWRRASELFTEALEQSEAARGPFVAQRCGDDEALASEVLDLLAAHGRAGILDGAFGPAVEHPGLEERVAEALADRYRLVGRLGEGGTAVVFLAWEKKHDRRVVLKVMRPDVEILFGHDRFLEEVRLASTLSHPHILGFIDSGRADGLLYYVMPHVEGETLYERLSREGRLTPAAALPLLHDVAEALAYAHTEGVIHRDLKPGNVLCAGAHAYLLDFGVAKALRGPPEQAPRTRVGFVPGTPRYMAPEQIDGTSEIGPAVDVFAWGQLAHECLTGGVMPSSGLQSPEISPRLAEAVPDAPPRLAELVGQALSRDPDARPDADRLVAELAEIASPPDSHGSIPSRAPRPVTGARGRVGWLLAAAAVIAILTIGVSRGPDAADADPTALFAGPIAVAEFRNETGDPALDFVGRLAGDWITQGLQDLGISPVVPWPTALASSTDAASADPIPVLHRETGARMVVAGAFYRTGTDLRFQAEIVDAAARQVRVALEPIRAPAHRPEDAVAELRERIMGSLAVLGGRRGSDVPGLENRAPTFEAYRLFDRGMTHYLAQEYGEATPAFLEAYERDTTFTTSLLYGATTAWNTGDRHVTDSLVREVAARRDRLTEYDDLRWQTLSAMLRNDGQESLRVLRRAVALAPGSRAGYNLAYQAIMMHRPEEALSALDAMDPNVGPMREWAQYWTQRTHALHLLGRHAEEALDAREMLLRHPERTLAWVLEARALAALGDIPALEESLAASAVLPPTTYWSHGAALTVAGEELLAHGARDAAESYLTRAVEWLDRQIVESPDLLAHRYWRGSALYDLGRWDDASRVFEALLVERPTSTAYLGMAAISAARSGDRPRAMAYLEEDRWGYEHGDRLIYTARAEIILGDRDRALSLTAQALDLGAPGYPWMHASGYHDFLLLRADPRIARLIDVPLG